MDLGLPTMIVSTIITISITMLMVILGSERSIICMLQSMMTVVLYSSTVIHDVITCGRR